VMVHFTRSACLSGCSTESSHRDWASKRTHQHLLQSTRPHWGCDVQIRWFSASGRLLHKLGETENAKHLTGELEAALKISGQ